MKKVNKATTEFPRIYRIITERSRIVIGIVSILAFIGLVFAGIDLTRNTLAKLTLEQKRGEVLSSISHWEKVAATYPGYRDAYFTLAVLYYQLNEKEKAREYLEKALTIDPNFEKGRELERKLKIDPPAGEAGN